MVRDLSRQQRKCKSARLDLLSGPDILRQARIPCDLIHRSINHELTELQRNFDVPFQLNLRIPGLLSHRARFPEILNIRNHFPSEISSSGIEFPIFLRSVSFDAKWPPEISPARYTWTWSKQVARDLWGMGNTDRCLS
jgi:hypothetical protein